MGDAATLAATPDPIYAGEQSGVRCVQDILYADNPVVTFTNPSTGYQTSYATFAMVQQWFTREFQSQRQGAPVGPTEVTVLPPITLTDAPPARGANDPCRETLEPYFSAQAAAAGYDLSGYNTVAYVYLHSYENPFPFWSCAYGSGSLPARVYVSFIAYQPATQTGVQAQCYSPDVQVVIHELTHTLGATDAYRGFGCLDPDGLPEPNKSPKYPQTYACVMCGNRMVTETGSAVLRLPQDFDTLKICERAALDSGWRSPCNYDGVCRDLPSLGVYESSGTCKDCP
jgi:hypothetical protein